VASSLAGAEGGLCISTCGRQACQQGTSNRCGALQRGKGSTLAGEKSSGILSLIPGEPVTIIDNALLTGLKATEED
jgi:hypothetical protein